MASVTRRRSCHDAPVPSSSPARRVLVVDDEESMRDLVRTALDFVGYEVATASDGLEALALVPTFAPDLVVLDVMMPRLDGMEVVRRLRAAGDRTPVVLLTARDAPQEVVEALAAGGDDHVAKPFHLQVLVARIEAVLRRVHPEGAVEERLAFADLELDEAAHRVWRGGELVALSPTEFKLLRYLMLNPDRVVSKAQIVDHIWQYDFDGDTSIVETHMSYLRKKLGPPRLIQTVRGVGYALREDDR
jgi:two-component system OmpR family response regulator